nr:zinc finger, CCHC-type [Tanacetum cinerariifolium]
MDVKTTFLNGDLDEKVYMKQPEGLVMPGNEHMVCKLVKSLYGLKQAPKQWHQKFDEVVLSSGFHLNQSDNTDQNHVDKTKKFLSSRFSMKDMGEAGVILGIKIKRKNKGIVITQSHYIKKILKKFNREDCSPGRCTICDAEVGTPLIPNHALRAAVEAVKREDDRRLFHSAAMRKQGRRPRGGAEECQWQEFTRCYLRFSYLLLTTVGLGLRMGMAFFPVNLVHDGAGGSECTLVKVSLIPPWKRCEGQEQRPLRGHGKRPLQGQGKLAGVKGRHPLTGYGAAPQT